MNETRKLSDLVSVGPATVRDLNDLGIRTVDDLKGQSAAALYEQLQEIRGQKMDICCKDVYEAAIAQANDPDLPAKKRQWPYWSKVRKGQDTRG